jgi:type II secretory ATPase GspE/PulE/Tfp pilus assembly ATPase PilB-like protein
MKIQPKNEKLNAITVVFQDQLLGNNELIIKSICALWSYNACDVIFIPNSQYVSVKLKLLNGTSENDIARINYDKFNQLKISIKLACNLSIINENIPQTGSFHISIDNQNYSIRASLHPTNYGECLCFRLIRSSLFSIVHNVANKLSKGLNIIGGRTCSGKTTVLYSTMLKFSGHVISLEDPVEFTLNNISQTDVSVMGFEDGINSTLRQNPDLICIGEIRDSISAKAAVKAALTGHITLATIHITSPSYLKSRLLDLDCIFFEDVLKKLFFMNNFQLMEIDLSNDLH